MEVVKSIISQIVRPIVSGGVAAVLIQIFSLKDRSGNAIVDRNGNKIKPRE